MNEMGSHWVQFFTVP